MGDKRWRGNDLFIKKQDNIEVRRDGACSYYQDACAIAIDMTLKHAQKTMVLRINLDCMHHRR